MKKERAGFEEDEDEAEEEKTNISPMKKRPKTIIIFDEEQDNEKDDNMYDMLHTNCKFRKQIHDLRNELEAFKSRRKDLEERNAALKKELKAKT